MAQFFAALASDGGLVTPRVARDGPLSEPAARIPLDETQLLELRAALVEVVNEAGGTARGSRLRRWTLAGKTGTAQNPHGEDHAWFIGFAPAEAPAIVAMMIVEAGGHGSSAAAPYVSRLIERYLESIETGVETIEVAGRR
jgi:penicillin-binding protein 2